tara:strand:- start:5892 stop:6023 length:132 start_codon:yes stop_codon:yes gene_type:complete
MFIFTAIGFGPIGLSVIILGLGTTGIDLITIMDGIVLTDHGIM